MRSCCGDQFAEGAGRELQRSSREDMTYYPTAFMLLQFTRKIVWWVNNKATVRSVLMPSFKRIPPNDVFPSPTVSPRSKAPTSSIVRSRRPDFAALAGHPKLRC